MVAAKAHRRPAGSSRADRFRKIAGPAVMHGLLIFLGFLAVMPFVWMFFASFRPFRELVESRGDILPHVWTLQNYREILMRVNFGAAFLNSIIAAVSVTAVSVFTSAVVGFIFAKYRFWGKEALFTLILATMMVPFAVVLVPLYITIVQMQIHNNLMGIIVTGFWSTFGIFMLRQFMETIPNEMLDAARIDGSSEWRIFLQIIIPLSGAPMAALTIFNFLGNWDSFLWPLVVLNSPEKQTIPLVLAGLRSLYWTRYDMWSAGSMLTVVPIMILYAFASKHMIKGIAMSGMKL
jgi:multiple sugar transport system permease protein